MTTINASDMPAPRLELRWEDTPRHVRGCTVKCVYELVLRLGEHDIRREREDEHGERLPDVPVFRANLGETLSDGSAARRYRQEFDEVDTPFRDGAHAHWDAEQLGGLPIYAVAAGRAMLVEKRR